MPVPLVVATLVTLVMTMLPPLTSQYKELLLILALKHLIMTKRRLKCGAIFKCYPQLKSTTYGNTPLHYAALQGKLDVVWDRNLMNVCFAMGASVLMVKNG